MFIREPCYSIRELAQENLHIHTSFSRCAKPEMTLAAILQEAEKSGLKRIALTDHSPDPQDIPFAEKTEILRAQYAAIDTPVQVLFGSELSAYGVNKFGETKETEALLDYRLFTHNHYHIPLWEHPQERTAEGYKQHAFAVLNALFASGRADCIAHPLFGRFISSYADKTEITRAISDAELGDILQNGNAAQVAWELNTGAVQQDPAFFKRYFQIGKEIGVVFHLGTDAHRLAGVDTTQYIETIENILY